MGVQLVAGERFNLIQASPGLQKIAIALGWNVPSQYEMDVSAFMLGEEGKLPNEQYFVFYNNVRSPDGSLRHANGTSTGKILGDDETLYLNFAKLDPAIQEIVFIVTIHDAEKRKQSFGDIQTAFIRLEDVDTGSELARYNLQEPLTQETALEFGRLYLKNGEWRFQAVGQGYSSGLQAFVDRYYPESSTLPNSQPTLTEDAQVIQQFIERVENSSQDTPQADNLSSNSDNLESNKSSPESQSLVNSLNSFLEIYNAGSKEFNNCNLIKIDLSDWKISYSEFIGVNLEEANLTDTKFSFCDFSESCIDKADLSGSEIILSKLVRASIKNTNLLRTRITSCNLYKANLSNSDLTSSLFLGINTHTILVETNFYRANLTEVFF
ncbi:MAG: TerD family protein [Desertifilum sp.]|nr:TerD family protein [Desertifilum sp.]